MKRLALLALLAGCAHSPNVPAVTECVKAVRAACGDEGAPDYAGRTCLRDMLTVCHGL